jgi:CRISPR system Cascade subunit CasD
MLDDVAAALDRPERPLFIGRKPFLPSRPVHLKTVEAKGVQTALESALADGAAPGVYRAQWPRGEGEEAPSIASLLADQRDWSVGVHTGQRGVVEGRLVVPR